MGFSQNDTVFMENRYESEWHPPKVQIGVLDALRLDLQTKNVDIAI